MESLITRPTDLLAHVTHLLQKVQSELTHSEAEASQSHQKAGHLYEILLESGEKMRETGIIWRKEFSAQQAYIERYQTTGKAYVHALNIYHALQTKNDQKIELALDFIASDLRYAYRFHFGLPICEYYQSIYERALAINEQDILAAKQKWDEAKEALYVHTFETLPRIKAEFLQAKKTHKQAMENYDQISTINARAHARTSAFQKRHSILQKVRHEILQIDQQIQLR